MIGKAIFLGVPTKVLLKKLGNLRHLGIVQPEPVALVRHDD
jgi:hypothetical protein